MVATEWNQKLVISSHNTGKIKEFYELFKPFNITLFSSLDFNIDKPKENGNNFSENALIKAYYTYEHTGLASLSDDSGICIEALEGQPGIFSARWAGPKKDFSEAIKKVEKKLKDLKIEKACAFFICSLAIVWPDGSHQLFEGRVDGRLIFPPRGNFGFGYDPIFIPHGRKETFGEMDPKIKKKISHRAEAFKLLCQACFNEK
jgi:XTP/dITP diphosphohydrolase